MTAGLLSRVLTSSDVYSFVNVKPIVRSAQDLAYLWVKEKYPSAGVQICQSAVLLTGTILEEMSKDELNKYFDYKSQNFLHAIDTFYYSVKLNNDFTQKTDDRNVKRFRNVIASYTETIKKTYRDMVCPFNGCGSLLMKPIRYSKYYNFCFSLSNNFDIFFATSVPPASDDSESVTSEIIVQIRSYALWSNGIIPSFEMSLGYVKAICKQFNFTISEIKENRLDYCWHTNYIANPEKYFDIRSLHNKAITRIHKGFVHWSDNATGYEIDYVAYGKRSNKIFLRIYLKTKEVVEMGYKGWFLKLWLLYGMISNYDFYCLQKCYEKKQWKYLDTARLEWYLEYGNNEEIKEEIKTLIQEKKLNYLSIRKLANKLTPKVTQIMNVEFQTMRRASKSFVLLPLHDYSKYGYSARVYQTIDNTDLICNYLTHDTFRLVNDKKIPDEYNDFWKRLRRQKLFDGLKHDDNDKIVREYNSKLDLERVKKKFVNSAVTVGLYYKGLNTDSVLRDCLDAVSILNDNDIEQAEIKKDIRLNTDDGSQYGIDTQVGTKEWESDDVNAWFNEMIGGKNEDIE